MEVNINDIKYNEYINQLNEYTVSTDGIFKKITDDINNIIDIKYDEELERFIKVLNKSLNKQNLIDKCIKDNKILIKIDKIKLDNYRTESDKILVLSYGNEGLKLTIKFSDYTIYEESLCMDDFQYTKKEDIIPQIRKKYNILKEKYLLLCVYLYVKIYKPDIDYSEFKKDKPNDDSYIVDMKTVEKEYKDLYKLDMNQFNLLIPQVAGNK